MVGWDRWRFFLIGKGGVCWSFGKSKEEEDRWLAIWKELFEGENAYYKYLQK